MKVGKFSVFTLLGTYDWLHPKARLVLRLSCFVVDYLGLR